MMKRFRKFLMPASMAGVMLTMLQFTSCNNDDEEMQEPPGETGSKTELVMFSVSTGLPGGTVTFAELDDNSTKVTISLTGVAASANHPAHIHNNSGAEGGAIAVSLEPVTGATGKSETIVSMLDDGTVITYQDLIEYDGHVNVHLSAGELGTLVAQGDIGPNAFTANIEDYDLQATGASGISGDVTFIERVSGEILVILQLENTPAGGQHPAHIHNGSAASGGGIAISLNPVNGDNGFSLTDIKQFDDGTPVTFSDLKEFEGHVKVHLSASELGTVVASGDIGDNILTGEMKEYSLSSVAVEGISGKVTLKERKSGKTLVEIALQNTPQGGSHPAHIHTNSFAEGGGVIVPLSNVNGDNGMSLTDVGEDKNQNVLTYDELINYDGHVMVHLSADQISTVVARGDIGQNALTENFKEYPLGSAAVEGIDGMVTFSERVNGESLVTIMLNNTPENGVHPAHLHANTAAEGGAVKVTLKSVNGNTGVSYTNVSQDNQANPLSYDDLIGFDGHLMVHLSAEEISTIVARGDVGRNALTGEKLTYDLGEVNGSGVSGTVTFSERVSGYTLATIMLLGTPTNGDHPAHIHENSVANGGGIVISLNNVDGNTGISMTQIEKDNSGNEVKFSDLGGFDGHVKVHLSPADLASIVAAGDIGSNGNGGSQVSYLNDIRPILDANCQVAGCHGSNSSLPSWATYADVQARASDIKSKTGSKAMPPSSSGKSLTNEQIQKIADWVDDGAKNN